MPGNKFDYKSAEHAHFRIDELEKDFKTMAKCIEQIAKSSEKTAQINQRIKWVLIGGLSFYIIESIGIIEFLKIAI